MENKIKSGENIVKKIIDLLRRYHKNQNEIIIVAGHHGKCTILENNYNYKIQSFLTPNNNNDKLLLTAVCNSKFKKKSKHSKFTKM